MSERVLYEFSRDKGVIPHDEDERLSQAIAAARGYRDWRSYAMVGNKVAQEPSTREKRVARYMLVGQAIDAFEDVPKEEPGHQFLKNDWGLGPFYAWDQNFLKYVPD